MAQFRLAREEGTRENTYFYHIQDGLHYHESDRRQGTIYYKCVRAGRGCRGRATYDAVDGFVHTAGHNHEPDLIYPEEMALRRNILRRCENLDYLSFPRIIFAEGRRFGPEAVARCTYNRLRTSMRNARMKRYPPLPANLNELTQVLLNPQYQVLTMTDDGLDNIYAGSVDDVDGYHHILFMSERMVRLARTFTVLHSDGTFRSVPSSKEFAKQVFCIVAVWNSHIITLGWALMSRLTENAYTAVLQLLRQLLGPQIQLTRAITDFEAAEQNAWRNVFGVRVQGCLWHLCRAFLLIVAMLGLLNRMMRIEEVNVIIRMTMGLALLPENMVVRGYRVILRHAMDEGGYIFRIVRPYLTYVWRSWVSRPQKRARMVVFGSRQRTNNCCESQNHQLNDEAGTHSNTYMFLNSLVRLEQRAHNTVLALNEFRRVTRARRRSSIYNDAQIQNATEELLDPPGPLNAAIFRFLTLVSHTMDNMVQDLIAEVGARRN